MFRRVPLTLRARTVFKTFSKMHAFYLYLLAQQKERSTLRCQKFGLFYLTLNAKFVEFNIKFVKAIGSTQKNLKIN